ncbi:MAG: beta-ketoacyl-[acyl-carrier-protein] synthase family protein [Deltaproteobacteria bacterium]|nr:beta-ketoacyl-[acyl-carrier-protein] synthase family protein [Deltaproteobacteria bacterium]
MSTDRVVITGVGVLAPNGIGKEKFAGALWKGASGIGYVTLFDVGELSIKTAGEVRDFDFGALFPNATPGCPRSVQFALTASKMALEDAELDVSMLDPKRAGVVLGCTTNRYELQELEYRTAQGTAEVPYLFDTKDIFLPGRLAGQYGFQGPLVNVDMACSSGNQAIMCARDLIRSGNADVVVTGGVDVPINMLVYAAFCQIRAMSKRDDDPTAASRPFDKQRDGFVLSEGAGLVLVESLEHAMKRGARIYAEIIGAGLTSDAHHMLIPDKSGAQMLRAMQLALRDARLSPWDLSYINAHGTATRLNDSIESHAIGRLLDSKPYAVPVSSVKSMIGHTLGAAGALEIITCLLSMEQAMLPPTINLEERDEDCADLDYVPNVSRSRPVSICMSNSFAFGGSNTSLILRKYDG